MKPKWKRERQKARRRQAREWFGRVLRAFDYGPSLRQERTAVEQRVRADAQGFTVRKFSWGLLPSTLDTVEDTPSPPEGTVGGSKS